LTDSAGNKLEKISRKGRGAFSNLLTDADKFFVNFQPQMDWQHRALIMSALFIIDFMMFSRQGNNNRPMGIESY
jgi:hypothetical protein